MSGDRHVASKSLQLILFLKTFVLEIDLCLFTFVGFDQVPVDSMQGLEIGSHHGSNYGPMDTTMPELGPSADLDFQNLDSSGMHPQQQQPPQHQGDQNQMAAWFDTDL